MFSRTALITLSFLVFAGCAGSEDNAKPSTATGTSTSDDDVAADVLEPSDVDEPENAMALDAPSGAELGPLLPEQSCTTGASGSFLGQNVDNLTLPNCNKNPVSLHTACGTNGAMWLLGTTG